MGKFIELHRIPLGGCDAFPILVNLDDVSVFFPVSGTTLVALRRPPDLAVGPSFRVAESYDEIYALITDPEALRVLTDIACSGGLLVGSELAMIFLGPGNKATDSKGEQKEGGDG